MGIRAVLAGIARSEEIGQSAKIESKPAQGTAPVTEDLAAKTPARPQTDEVARIKAAWRVLGIKDLDGVRARAGLEPVREHLAKLRRWAESSPQACGIEAEIREVH